MRRGYFDKLGEPITRERFCELFEDMVYRRIAEDLLPDGRRVSTVWLGIDHDFLAEHPAPLIFETMAFGPRPDGEMIGEVLAQKRSTTEAAARLVHAQVLAQLNRPPAKNVEGA